MKKYKKILLKEIDHLKVLNHRGMLLDSKSKKRLTRLLLGQEAEDNLVAILIDMLPKEWLILRNVWIEIDGNRTEVDLLILTPKCWWIIEVKNYKGKFEYRDQFCYLNQQPFPDQIAACRNRLRIINKIVQKFNRYTPNVICSMIFMNEMCEVVSDKLKDFEIVSRSQLYQHITKMLERHHHLKYFVSLDESKSLIENFRIDNPFLPHPLDKEDLNRAIKGFSCPKCYEFAVEVELSKLKCRVCHHCINKAEGVIRAACDLGLLYFHDPNIITSANLYAFTGKMMSQKGIRRILKAHLPHEGNSSATIYHNYALPYEKIQSKFNF